ncbi:YggS family pyridoxal phosphate-dependent enzyme [Viridibacillus sp. FSL E2-0187]|uniref:YggS family pyridoxal phosphate-dependent enzyme n=1 Tax=Viridibacillus TaxID=496496 RepID=UPI00187B9234|nr:YggS family pyridoxal phosphate-dependent enzyme [Viridibacillus sp. JNUCC-6]QOV10744.1 YggS family pyridoxal phosphate-dependent enzyme [Viridibacillus sp. JNUCC-6]
MTLIINNLEEIQLKIEKAANRVGRQVADVSIIAVTKQVSTERAIEALDAGLNQLGENRPEGLLEKRESIIDGAVWHYIGSMQTRKVKQVIDKIDYLHSLDRISLADEIEKRATRIVNCFVQVNVSGEESKHGLQPEEVIPFIEQLSQYSRIRVVGLMTMAPNTEDLEVVRNVFKNLKKLQLEVEKNGYVHAPCHDLSMGMSNDYEIAVEEGATYVRIGTALVGNERRDS